MINSLLIFALTLLVKCTVHSASLALPAGRMEEDRRGEDHFISVLGEDEANAMETADLSRRFPLIGGRLADEDGTKRIFILPDLGSKRTAGSDTSSSVGRILPMLSMWRADRTTAGTLKDEQHDGDDLIPMARRDLDVLRCMIGRVYRPCWTAGEKYRR